MTSLNLKSNCYFVFYSLYLILVLTTILPCCVRLNC